MINMDEHRKPDDPGYASCPCGEAWFELRTQAGPGAVCMTAEGTVTGYLGIPHCIACDRPYTPS